MVVVVVVVAIVEMVGVVVVVAIVEMVGVVVISMCRPVEYAVHLLVHSRSSCNSSGKRF